MMKDKEELTRMITEGHKRCQECLDEFKKFRIHFNPHSCSTCSEGRKLRKLEIQLSDAEKSWNKCDWNSSKLKDFYHS